MHMPTIRGLIRRRILVNYRVDPDQIARHLPAPFRPKRFGDVALAGICLIRLEQIRPMGIPAALGLASENAAHRLPSNGRIPTASFRTESSSFAVTPVRGSIIGQAAVCFRASMGWPPSKSKIREIA